MRLPCIFHMGNKTGNNIAGKELMMRHRRRVIFSVVVTAIGKSSTMPNIFLVTLYQRLSEEVLVYV